MRAVVDPDAKQVYSLTGELDKSYVIHCVGVEKEADLVQVFTVSLSSIISHT